jgi:mannosyl-3-phosphoglycerate phosphatase
MNRSLLGHAALIVTDLDGTLLDRDSYSFAAALPALEELRRRNIPLILNSSKTAMEIRRLQQELEIDTPFICENGAALHRVRTDGSTELWRGFAPGREVILTQLRQLRAEQGYRFTGFADMSHAQINACTGLTEAGAIAASARQYSEPLLWEDTPQRLQAFLEQLRVQQLEGVQGGRFLTVTGPCNKGAALAALVAELGPADDILVVALGDSPNDLDLLELADIAVIVRSPHSEALTVQGPQRVIRSQAAGPQGWQEVMQGLLAEPQLLIKRN